MKRISCLVMIGVISTLICLSTAGIAAANGSESYWVWENPSPTGNDLYDVACLDGDHAWAVGAEGTILFHDGVRWNPKISPTTNQLNGVWAIGVDDVWAVGEEGTVLHYDGVSWQNDTAAENFAAGKRLMAISASDASNVVAVGDSGTALHYNGSAWTKKSIPGGYNQYCVAVLDAGNAWSGGTYGKIYHFNGTSWIYETKPDGALSEFEAMQGICAIAVDDVWAVGDIGTVMHKGPAGWKDKSSLFDHLIHSKNLFAVSVLGTSDLFIVGQDGNIFRGEFPIIEIIKVPSGSDQRLSGLPGMRERAMSTDGTPTIDTETVEGAAAGRRGFWDRLVALTS